MNYFQTASINLIYNVYVNTRRYKYTIVVAVVFVSLKPTRLILVVIRESGEDI